MKRSFLCTVLIIISLQGRLYAQSSEEGWTWFPQTTQTDLVFNISHNYTNIRDFVNISGCQMILELDNVTDFDRLKHLDSILILLRKDIAFYRDSLDANKGANTLIDYVLTEGYDFRQMRFTKHKPQGDMYVNKQGEISILKIEQDTIKIVMHVKGKETETYWRQAGTVKRSKEKIKFSPQYDIQVMLCLNSYSNMDTVITDSNLLRRAIDTLQVTTSKRTIKDPVKFPSSSVCRVNKMTRSLDLTIYNGIIKNEYGWPKNASNRSDKITVVPNIGVGLIGNTLAPTAELGLCYYNRRGYHDNEYNTYINLFAAPYFFFDRNSSGGYFVSDNWFVNIEMGGAGEILGIKTKLLTGGIGYLAIEKGGYLKGTTLKAFLNIRMPKCFTISPEVIFTGNLKQVFPGLTVKVFQ